MTDVSKHYLTTSEICRGNNTYVTNNELTNNYQ